MLHFKAKMHQIPDVNSKDAVMPLRHSRRNKGIDGQFADVISDVISRPTSGSDVFPVSN